MGKTKNKKKGKKGGLTFQGPLSPREAWRCSVLLSVCASGLTPTSGLATSGLATSGQITSDFLGTE
jgi:hypothetical protein